MRRFFFFFFFFFWNYRLELPPIRCTFDRLSWALITPGIVSFISLTCFLVEYARGSASNEHVLSNMPTKKVQAGLCVCTVSLEQSPCANKSTMLIWIVKTGYTTRWSLDLVILFPIWLSFIKLFCSILVMFKKNKNEWRCLYRYYYCTLHSHRIHGQPW